MGFRAEKVRKKKTKQKKSLNAFFRWKGHPNLICYFVGEIRYIIQSVGQQKIVLRTLYLGLLNLQYCDMILFLYLGLVFIFRWRYLWFTCKLRVISTCRLNKEYRKVILLMKELAALLHAFFYKQRFFSTHPQCCLIFSWIELQMLLRCCLIHLSIIIPRHFFYLLYFHI